MRIWNKNIKSKIVQRHDKNIVARSSHCSSFKDKISALRRAATTFKAF